MATYCLYLLQDTLSAHFLPIHEHHQMRVLTRVSETYLQTIVTAATYSPSAATRSRVMQSNNGLCVADDVVFMPLVTTTDYHWRIKLTNTLPTVTKLILQKGS